MSLIYNKNILFSSLRRGRPGVGTGRDVRTGRGVQVQSNRGHWRPGRTQRVHVR